MGCPKHPALTSLLVCLWLVHVTVPAKASAPENLLVYLEPFAPEPASLVLRIRSLHAISDDGESIPLTLSLNELVGSEIDRERRFASGRLEPGRYSKLALTITSAKVHRQGQWVTLISPLEAIEIPAPIDLQKGLGAVLKIRLSSRDFVENDFRFAPVFHAFEPPRPAAGLLGLVSNRGSDTVLVFDKSSGRVVGLIPTGRAPSGMALDPRQPRAHITLSGEDSVITVGLLDFRVLAKLRLRGGDRPTELAITPGAETLVTVNSGSRSISLIDPFSLIEIDRIAVGDVPSSIVLEPGGRRGFVLNRGSNNVFVIDLVSRQLVGAIATESRPFRGQFNRDGDRLFIAHELSPHLLVLNPTDLTVNEKILVGPGANSLQIDPQADRLYLGRNGMGFLEIYDPLSLLPADSLPIAANTRILTIDLDQNRLFATLPELEEVHAFEMVGLERAFRIEVGIDPYWVTVAGDR